MRDRIKLTLIYLCAAVGVCAAVDWKPADGPLVTRWARDVTPETVWQAYPRPQMVRRDWVNLNGLWDYAIRPRDAERPHTWDGRILVPFPVESALSGVRKSVQPDQRLWYRCAFTKPDMQDGERLLLHFGAVDWQCTAWVNNTLVGKHTGGYDPFTFDITAALRAGQNEIVLAVWDPTDRGYQPRGKQVLRPHGIMYTAVTGIWQTVWIEPVPQAYIRSIKIEPDVDGNRIGLSVDIAGNSDAYVVHGEVILPPDSDGYRDISGRWASPTERFYIGLPSSAKTRLWSPDDPYLYDLRIALHRRKDRGTLGAEKVDEVTSYCGMRKIEVRKDEQGINRLFLNHRVLFQFGPLDQGWWPDGLYLPASDEALKYDIVMTKSFGMNMARKHVKYECARWYYWCDKLGLMAWQDMPSGDAGRNAESKANYRRELKAMIDTLRNHPSIVMWVPFNEGWGQHDTGEVVRWIQDYDPTRPVNEASGWTDHQTGDVFDMHSYPGPGMRPPEEKRVVVLGEFGGLGMPVSGHTWQAEKNWGYVSFQSAEALTDAYVGLLQQLRPLIGKGLSAAVYTQTSDVEVEVNGLMTYDRALVKMDRARMVQAAEKLYLPPPMIKTLVPSSEREKQIWKYTTTEPAGNWFAVGFDDQAWLSGPGGFGTRGTPGAHVGTQWSAADIWLRRTFALVDLPAQGQISLSIHHDEDAEVYLNGQRVKALRGYVTGYVTIPLDPDAVKALGTGQNTLALHCHQTRGGQYIDAGLVVMIER